MELSFWERQTFFAQTDALIVGSGIVGLSTARSLKKKHPAWKIMVIDRGILPHGASTRNAGFACFGSAGELVADLKMMPEDEVVKLVEKRFRGLIRLREVLGDQAIDYEPLGGYEIFTADEKIVYEECLGQLPYLNGILRKIFGADVYRIADERITSFGLKGVQHMLFNSAEGQLDTGKMIEALLLKVRHLGVKVYNGISVRNWQADNNAVVIETGEGFNLKTDRMIVCTNGFARQLMPELQVEPGRAQVLITSEIDNLKLRGSFHADKGYYYFRNVGNRVLFGGGRNLDFETEKTTEFGLTDIVQNRLEKMLAEMILPASDYKIEQRWSGIMGLGNSKSTIIKKINDRVYCAVRMGGMGVAIGSLVGEECAGMVE